MFFFGRGVGFDEEVGTAATTSCSISAGTSIVGAAGVTAATSGAELALEATSMFTAPPDAACASHPTHPAKRTVLE